MEPKLPRVAIVDDEESIRRALLRLVRGAELDAEAFDSAAAFLASLSEHVPACLVLDLQMPAMTGLELQQELLRHETRPEVIIMTAHDRPGIRERCLALGARYYFCKPIDGTELVDSIRRIVGNDRGAARSVRAVRSRRDESSPGS